MYEEGWRELHADVARLLSADAVQLGATSYDRGTVSREIQSVQSLPTGNMKVLVDYFT